MWTMTPTTTTVRLELPVPPAAPRSAARAGVAQRSAVTWAAAIAVVAVAGGALGQATRPGTTGPANAAAAAPAATQPADAAVVTFNFPEPVELRALVDYVSDRLGVAILYDEQLSKKENAVTIRAPGGVAPAALLDFLRGVLRMKGFVLVEPAEPGGVRTIVPAANAAAAGGRPTTVEFLKLAHADATRVGPQVKQMLAAMKRNDAAEAGFEVTFDARTNQVGAIGPADTVAAALKIAKSIDLPITGEENPIRFYKLTNATAADVLDTIRALEGEAVIPRTAAPAGARPGRTLGGLGTGATGLGGSTFGGGGGVGGGSGIPPAEQQSIGNGMDRAAVGRPARDDALPARMVSAAAVSSDGGDRKPGVSVTADTNTNTNTIIVRGGAAAQATYDKLIKQLDKRRPQVLLEATVVTLDTTDDYHLGVEVSANIGVGSSQILSFTQFGLSTVNKNNGKLTVAPAPGFNGAVINSDVASAVVQALQSNRRARVKSAPRVLVNDNATGTLTSIAEQPFTSVNASTTVATTSFGGYADAGTTITLTPHISEGDYLQLEYAVELSSFTGTADRATGTPPPRQSDKVESKVTIPDGSTIIVGGLTRRESGRTLRSVPFLGEIPVLKYLFSDDARNDRSTTLFVFLRPVILRDDRFEDLRNLSEADLKAAGIPSNFPQSTTVLMR